MPRCMKSNTNKGLVRVISTFSLGINFKMAGREESIYCHDEDVMNGKNTVPSVRVINDDTDIFVLLIFWMWRLHITACVQLDQWCGDILSINESSSFLCAISHQLLGMPALSGCDNVSYQFGHGKAMALKVKYADYSGLYTVFGEQSGNHQQLLETGHQLICSFYGVATDNRIVSARCALYIKSQQGKLYMSNLFHRQTLICHITSCEHTTKSCSGSQPTSKLQV